MSERNLLPTDAAERLNCSRRQVYNLCERYVQSRGKEGLRHYLIGTRGIRIPESAIEEFRSRSMFAPARTGGNSRVTNLAAGDFASYLRSP